MLDIGVQAKFPATGWVEDQIILSGIVPCFNER
jgi:hypothetical protein